MDKIDYLEEERVKIWAEISDLKIMISKKTTDYESEAKQASKKCSEYRNRSLNAKETIDDVLSKIEESLVNINSMNEAISKTYATIDEIGQLAITNKNDIDAVEERIESLNLLYESRDSLDEKLDDLTTLADDAEDKSSKFNAVYNLLLKRKKEIDDLYYEINGYEVENEEAEEPVYIEGIKGMLEKTYTQVENNLKDLEKTIEKTHEESTESYEEFIKSSESNYDEQVNKWRDEHASLTAEIRKLLPDALTAGLSHAFSKKKEDEISDGRKLSRTFYWSLIGLVLVSLIPFLIYMNQLQNGIPLQEVLYNSPRMVFSVMPLYLPFIWMAYSSSKKVNLSKRLVEEYAHKEVLSKTFEGLSRQIDDIEESEISSDLRIKLLFNILEVSSENPGKLITDYNKADHPLMDALDKSYKLGEAVDTLSKIPGLSKITRMLKDKSDLMLQEQSQNVEDGLNSLTPKSKNKTTATVDE